MNRFLVAIAIAVGLGFGLGIAFAPHFSSRTAQEAKPAEPTSEKSKSLIDADLEDYYRLKSMEEKYQKADEILGKVMLLFLQDLAIRINPAQIESLKKSILHPEEHEQLARTAPPVDNQPTPKPLEPEPTPTPANRTDNWKNNEKILGKLGETGDWLAVLRATKFEDPNAAISSFNSFSNVNGALKVINGRFAGTAQVRQDEWTILAEFRAGLQQNNLQGTERIVISKNGKVFSNSTGRGSLQSLHDSKGSQALLIRASPSLYFQLYYWESSDQFIGNIYQKTGNSQDYKYAGPMRLFRER